MLGRQRDVGASVRGLVAGDLAGDQRAVVLVAHARIGRGLGRRERLLRVARREGIRQPVLVAVRIGAVADQHLVVDMGGDRIAVRSQRVAREPGGFIDAYHVLALHAVGFELGRRDRGRADDGRA